MFRSITHGRQWHLYSYLAVTTLMICEPTDFAFAQELVASGNPFDLAISPDEKLLFWTDLGGEFVDGKIQRVHLETGDAKNVWRGGNPALVVADAIYAYVTEWTQDGVWCGFDPDSPFGAFSKIADGQDLVRYRGLALAAEGLYFADYSGIRFWDRSNSGAILLAATHDSTELAVDRTHVYWSEKFTGGGGVIRRVEKSSGSVQVLASGSGIGNPSSIVVDSENIFWVESSGRLRKKRKDGSAPSQDLYALSNPAVQGFGDLALTDTHVFWTETTGASPTSGRIRYVSKNGGPAIDLVAPRPDTPKRMALTRTHLYWTERTGIYRTRLPFGGDSDGDGLFDDWERFGVDTDGDGTIDVNLPAFGARVDHKDLFLEFDWMRGEEPTQAAIRRVKETFAAAPIYAGGVRNPDGQPGINVWIDTGNLTDAQASEGGAGVGTCGDGIDNDGDGNADAADPDCLVGDNLGGGNEIPASSICDLNSAFYATKRSNFDGSRNGIFRYGLSARFCGNSGGWGEVGGNDFIEYNHDAGTILHEIGHTLNLRHGGFENHNCKPNYMSVMNYDYAFGIPQVSGPSIIDFSPPRHSRGRAFRPLPVLQEDNLDETVVLDPNDASNQLIFVDRHGRKVRSAVGQRIDWNSDGDTNDTSARINIDTSSSVSGRPALCTNSSTSSRLESFDDWSNMVLAFQQFGDSASSAINPELEPEPTLEELHELQQELGLVRFVRGDCDGDGQVSGSVTDAVFMLQFNFVGSVKPTCIAACDVTGDGDTGGVTDAVYLLNYNFLGGPPPAAPFPDCGASTLPGDLELGCAESTRSCR